jgi:hypothetical protein
MDIDGFDQGLEPQQAWRGPVGDFGAGERHWFWVLMAILCWKGFWLVMAQHGDDNRYILLTYAMLYITWMVLKILEDE